MDQVALNKSVAVDTHTHMYAATHAWKRIPAVNAVGRVKKEPSFFSIC
jgi:hypothetical protein